MKKDYLYGKALEIKELIIKQLKSKEKAFELLNEAYRTGEFDKIIYHLEKAKTIK